MQHSCAWRAAGGIARLSGRRPLWLGERIARHLTGSRRRKNTPIPVENSERVLFRAPEFL